jgi:PAS domain S-box-containing protein
MTICAMNLRPTRARRPFNRFEPDEAGTHPPRDAQRVVQLPTPLALLCAADPKRSLLMTPGDPLARACERHQTNAAPAPATPTLPRDTDAALRRQRRHTAFALEAAGVGLWERAIGEGTQTWNAQMYRLRGLDPRDPRPVHELAAQVTAPADLDAALRLQRRHLELGEPYAQEYRVRWPDGTERWLASRGELVRDDQGRAVAIAGVDFDITEQRKAAALLHNTARSQHDDCARREAVTALSHELRTPLNAVLGFGQLLLEDPHEPPSAHQRARLEHIRQAASHMLALVNQTLDLARIEAGQQALAAEPVALADCAREAMSWVELAACSHGVTLREEGLEGYVLADARRLRQVAVNLVSNAVKYNRAGGWVVVQTRRCVREGIEQCGLIVRDSGRGLARDQIERAFEPFNRLGAEREEIEGTGMGLTIARQLVQRMGGEVEVASEVGVGSEFRVWLPAAAQT